MNDANTGVSFILHNLLYTELLPNVNISGALINRDSGIPKSCEQKILHDI